MCARGGKDGHMGFLVAQPEGMASAAADVTAIGVTIDQANASAARTTIGLATAAADEVSTAITTLFNAYAQEGETLLGQLAALHGEFAQALAAASGSYANAQAANMAALTGSAGGANP